MANTRLQREIAALERRFTVGYEPTERTVVIKDLELPEGFSPGRVTVRIRLPDRWPESSARVELPWTLRCAGRVPRAMLTDMQFLVRGSLGDPIIYWPANWDEQTSLEKLLDEVLAELQAAADQEPTSGQAADHQPRKQNLTMAREKRIKISPAGTGEQETYDEAVVRPGDRPRDVLARIIDEQPDEFILRRKTSRAFPQTLDVYDEVEDGEKLKVATNATVGIGG